ncbi:MAG TPA: hypothetical protein DCQ50_01425 [Chryseobacterium sp.]|nr:hypothetical protein [Chryseobacterium sp.]
MAFLNILQKYKLDFRFRKTNFGISMGFEIEIEFCFWRLCFLNAENAKIFLLKLNGIPILIMDLILTQSTRSFFLTAFRF